ncbi:MAG: hypothetical protein AB1938_04070 [Myxococcota bacterium]
MRVLSLCAALILTACPPIQAPARPQLASFSVQVQGVYLSAGRTPLRVVSRCEEEYGGAANVPAEVKGTKACRYEIPLGQIEFDITATALDVAGEKVASFGGPVSFKVVPGDLAGGYEGRWAQANLGEITATVKSVHQYGEVRVWVEDAPPKPIYDGGVLVDGLPPEPLKRTYATGASPIIYFDDQTLQSLQQPDGFDNRSSPFVGEFVAIGKNPESGEVLKQSCEADPLRDQQPALMVVTGLDPAGFFVTDISACRLIERTADATGTQVRTPEPPEPCLVEFSDGGAAPIEGTDAGMGVCQISRKTCASRASCDRYLPGAYASMFVYNYNFPDGLNEGDLLFTLAGSIQEFTSTTQLVFPSWSIAESVRTLPPDQWNKWLAYARPYWIGGRTCGWDENPVPFLTDQLCGHNRRNLKMESLESGLVTIKQVRFPEIFENCDFNGDGTVPFFCESRDPNGEWFWTSCDFENVEPDEERVERECTQDCVLGRGPHQGRICSELSTFQGFGQFVVELGPAGPAWAGLDETIAARFHPVTAPAAVDPGDGGVALGASVRAQGFGLGVELAVVCDQSARYRVGNDLVTAGPTDALLEPGQIVRVTLAGSDTSVAFAATGAAANCSVGENSKARINLLTKDAIPQLNVNCRTDDPDPEAALQCQYLHGATFDLVGHLRHVQPARPRWMVIPRSPFDVCCHPGPGLGCPRPIVKCRE